MVNSKISLSKLETTGHSTEVRRPYLATPHRFNGLSSYRQIVTQARKFGRQLPLDFTRVSFDRFLYFAVLF